VSLTGAAKSSQKVDEMWHSCVKCGAWRPSKAQENEQNVPVSQIDFNGQPTAGLPGRLYSDPPLDASLPSHLAVP